MSNGSNRTATISCKTAAQLQPGDVVLLSGDPIADPDNDVDTPTTGLVGRIDPEGPACMAVTFVGFDVIGFPPGHALHVLPRTQGLAA